MDAGIRKKIGIGAGIFLLLWICFQIKADYDSLTEADDELPIMMDDSVIDLGNHIIAYRISSAQKLNRWADGEYIVICDLDTERDNIFLLPDIYGQIYDLRMEGTDFIYISYKASDKENMRSMHIPVHFVSQMDYAISTNYDGKILVEAGEDSEKSVAELPELVWEETAAGEGQSYTFMFERISSAYNIGSVRAGALCADYCLTVQNGEDNIIFRQTITGYPIAYEEVYWINDFSGDGFSDIAFCTFYDAELTNWAGIDFMIWNAEKEIYEPKPFPGELISEPLWNEKRASVICVNKREKTLDMYAFHDEDWELTGRLLPVYGQNSEGFLEIHSYKEVFYIDGEIAEENVIMPKTGDGDAWNEILSDKESFWGNGNKENIFLYPCTQDWVEKTVTIGSEIVEKYVKKKNGKDRGNFDVVNNGEEIMLQFDEYTNHGDIWGKLTEQKQRK